MRERIKFAVVAAMLMILTGLSWLLPLRFIIDGETSVIIALSLVISGAISVFSALYIRHEHHNASDGLPLMDERSKAVRGSTAGSAFMISAALILALFIISLPGLGIVEISRFGADEALLTVLIIMISAYLGTWTFMTYKWRLD